jgi:pimeloyl-ACP methyl ester carboxylesterase
MEGPLQTVSIRGRRISYQARPEQYDRSSLTTVLIHGSGGDSEDWGGQLDGLSDVVNVVAIDLPGHGSSDPPGERSVDAYAGWVVDLVEALGLEKVMLIGCSLGGAIAQWVALAGKPWLKAIGLVGTGARLRVIPAFLDGLLQDMEGAIRSISGYSVSAGANESLLKSVQEKMLKTTPGLMHGDLRACNEFDVMNRISEISLPTWILVGQDDRMTPMKYSQFLRERIAGSTLAVLEGAGHLAMVEKPGEFNVLLRDFLSRLGA